MEFKASDETISGQIAIGAGETRTFSLIARAMKQTQIRFPHIHFTVYSANAVDVTERLEHGTLDFGLLFEPVNKEHYQYLPMPFQIRWDFLSIKKTLLPPKSHHAGGSSVRAVNRLFPHEP